MKRKYEPSYPDSESDWEAWKQEELLREALEEERGKQNER